MALPALRVLAGGARGLPNVTRAGSVAMQKREIVMDLKVWAEHQRTHGDADVATELLDDYEWHQEAIGTIEDALRIADIEPGDDPVAVVERALQRFKMVSDIFEGREEFALYDDGAEAALRKVLTLGDHAQSFQWRVIGVLRGCGAVPNEGKCTLTDDQMIAMLKMLMP